jgi:hypothetical protein
MAEQLHAGQIVPQSGLYRIWHEPAHVGARNELSFIRGRRFPACPLCSSVTFELLQSHEKISQHRSAQGRRRRRSRRRAAIVAITILWGVLSRASGALLCSPSRVLRFAAPLATSKTRSRRFSMSAATGAGVRRDLHAVSIP